MVNNKYFDQSSWELGMSHCESERVEREDRDLCLYLHVSVGLLMESVDCSGLWGRFSA